MLILRCLLLVSMLGLFATCKKNDDSNPNGNPTPDTLGTDMGYGYLTFKGKTFFFSAYSVIPTTNQLTAAGTVIDDTIAYTLSVTFSQRPSTVADTVFINPSGPGAYVYLLATPTRTGGGSQFYYYVLPGEFVDYQLPNGKRKFILKNLTETSTLGLPTTAPNPLSAVLKQR